MCTTLLSTTGHRVERVKRVQKWLFYAGELTLHAAFGEHMQTYDKWGYVHILALYVQTSGPAADADVQVHGGGGGGGVMCTTLKGS